MARELTPAERHLIDWMLLHGKPEARTFLPQLEKASVTAFRCPCGCPTINLSIEGFVEPSGGLRVLAEFIFGNDENLSGIFVFEKSGLLAGLEVFGLAADAPKVLPSPETLRPFA